MLLQKISYHSYKIKLPNKIIDVYDKLSLEKITEKIVKKIAKKNKIRKLLILDIYIDDNYGTIILLNDYNKLIDYNNQMEVKIKVHTNESFLYKIDYFSISKDIIKDNTIYYYKNNFYLKINKMNRKKYLSLLENSEIHYENTDDIINNAIKINI